MVYRSINEVEVIVEDEMPGVKGSPKYISFERKRKRLLEGTEVYECKRTGLRVEYHKEWLDITLPGSRREKTHQLQHLHFKF